MANAQPEGVGGVVLGVSASKTTPPHTPTGESLVVMIIISSRTYANGRCTRPTQ